MRWHSLRKRNDGKGQEKGSCRARFRWEIEAFPAEVRQVFTNVIKNAVEATDEGGRIRIFSVSTQEAGRNGVLIHVADNGVGISEQVKSRLFSPFATTKQDSGSGLGLWVSRSILEKHDGTIRVSSARCGVLRDDGFDLLAAKRSISHKH